MMTPSDFIRELQQTHEQRAALELQLGIVAHLLMCLNAEDAYEVVARGAQQLLLTTSGNLYVRKDPGEFPVGAVAPGGHPLQAEPALLLHECQALRFMKAVASPPAAPGCRRAAAPACGSS